MESMVRSFNNSLKCLIKIFLESDKVSHKAGVTKHATNSLAHKSHLMYHVNIHTNIIKNVEKYFLNSSRGVMNPQNA